MDLPTAEAYRGASEILIWKKGAVSHLLIRDLTTEPVTQCLRERERENGEEFRATESDSPGQ